MKYFIYRIVNSHYYVYIDTPSDNVRALLNALSCWGGYDKKGDGYLAWEIPNSLPVDNMKVALNRLGAVQTLSHDWIK